VTEDTTLTFVRVDSDGLKTRATTGAARRTGFQPLGAASVHRRVPGTGFCQRFFILPAFVLAAVAASVRADDTPPPVALPVADVKRAAPVSFEKEILPIFSANCLACHNRTKAKADLVLETPAEILKGGESGPAVMPKNADGSLLLKVSAHRQDPVMPPKGNKAAAKDLTAEQLGLVKLWIDQGATGSAASTSAPVVRLQPVPAGLHAIYAVAVTPDGQYAACARGSEVHVYHLSTGRLVSRLTGHRDLVQSLAFSPDGDVLASGAYREVLLWRRPRDIKTFNITSAARGGLNALDASADGATVATGGADGVIRLWAAADGRQVKELAGHAGPVTAVRLSADGTQLLSAAADKAVRVWNVTDGTVFAQTTVPAEPGAVAWVNGGKQVAAAGADGVIRLWDLPHHAGAALDAPKELKGHDGAVTCLAAVPGTPTQLLSGGADATVRRWDLQAGNVVGQMRHGAPVTALSVRADGKRVASAGGTVVKLWDADGKPIADLKGDRYAAEAAAERQRDAAFAASEVAFQKSAGEAAARRHAEQVERVKKAAQADVEADKALAGQMKALEEKKNAKAPDADVKQAEAAANKAREAKAASADELRLAIKASQAAADAAAEAELALHAAEQSRQQADAALASGKAAAVAAEKPLRSVAFSTDAVTLAAAGDDAAVHTYSADTGAAWETFHAEGGPVKAVAFAGAAVIAGGADGALNGFDAAPRWTKQSQLGGDASSPFVDRVTALDFSPDGKLLATGGGVPSREGEVTLWEVDGARLVRKFDPPHSDAVLALDFSPDGKYLATAGADRFMKLIEVATGRPLKSFEGHAGHVLGVSFQRTGRTLVTASADNTVKVWDAVTGEQRKGIAGFDKEVTAVRFVGDTDQFVAAAGDGRVRLLRPDGGEVRSLGGASGFVYALDATRDGTTVVAGGEDGTLRAWNVSDGKSVTALPPPAATAAVAAP
jgi:WD40 repeat protein